MRFSLFQLRDSVSLIKAWFYSVGAITSFTAVAFSFNLAPAQSQTPSGTPPAAPQTTAPATQPGGRPVLRVGSEGESVSELQALLKLLGYYSGAVDGVYRASTAAAVTSFQQAVGLQADGIVGTATWNRLLPPSPGSTATTPTPVPSPAPAPSPTPTPAPSPAPTTPSFGQSGSGQSGSGQSSSDQSTSIDLPVLRMGMRGPAVSRLQERLKALGFYNGTIDGIFGAETQSAVQAAQRRFNLEADGIVGPATWTGLLQ